MIPDEVVEQVRTAADIVEIIGEFVQLKRSGSTWRGPCPFHQGKNPNFSVSPAHGSYHCFVCHESGDVFTFVRKHMGLDWPGAVKFVGEKCGIEVVDEPRHVQVQDPNTPNHEALAAAAGWFQQELRDERTGLDARLYLTQRGLSEDTWERFGIGFAPRDPQLLRRYLHTLGFDDDRLLESGLLVLREGEAEPRVRFRGRVIFPILDERGRHVGFGGRALGDEQPKYLNSPESPVFQKRRTLYGLQVARNAVRRSGRAIVVEGYLDAIRLVLAGIEEVVAPLGTALTEEQAQLLARYAKEVFLIYDSDEAGQKATFRSGLELLKVKLAVRVVTLPDDEDPDSFVRKYGAAGMEAHLSQAIDIFDRQVQLLERHGWFSDLRRSRRSVDKLLPTLRAAQDQLVRDLYITRLAEVTGLDKSAIVAEVEAAQRTGAVVSQGHSVSTRAQDMAVGIATRAGQSQGAEGEGLNGPLQEEYELTSGPVRKWEKGGKWKGRRGQQGVDWKTIASLPRAGADDPVERSLVRAMLADRGVAERVAERHPPQDFRTPEYRELFRVLLDSPIDEHLGQIAARLSETALRVLTEFSEQPLVPEAADVSLNMGKLDARVLQRRIDAILEEMGRAETRAEMDALLRERLELDADLRELLPIRSPRTKPRR